MTAWYVPYRRRHRGHTLTPEQFVDELDRIIASGPHLVRHESGNDGRLLWIEYLDAEYRPERPSDDDVAHTGWNSDIVVMPSARSAIAYEQAVATAGHARFGGPKR